MLLASRPVFVGALLLTVALETATSTAGARTSTVVEIDADAPGAARASAPPAPNRTLPAPAAKEPPTPPPTSSEPPAPPKGPSAPPPVTGSPDTPAFAPRPRTSELGIKLASQGTTVDEYRPIGLALSYGFWFSERFAVDLRAGFFQGTNLLNAEAGLAAYGFGGARVGLARGPGHLFDRWSTALDFYALIGAGATYRRYVENPFGGLGPASGSRVRAAAQVGLGVQLELVGPHLALVVELVDAYQPAEDTGHDLRTLVGLAIALDADSYARAPSTAPAPPRFGGMRVGLLASNTTAQDLEAAPGLALTVAVPVARFVAIEGYFAGFFPEERPPSGPGTVITPFPTFSGPADGLVAGGTIGVQFDVVRARAPAFLGEAPLQLRVYGVAAIGAGKPVDSDPIHVVGAVGAGFEMAWDAGFLVAVDVRDLLYAEGYDLSHLRTGVLLGWRFGS